MRIIFISIFITLNLGILLAQNFNEKIINTPYSDQTFGAIEMEGDVYFALSTTDVFFGNTIKSILYRADKDITILDSLDLTHHNGSDYFNVHNVLNASDSTLWVIGDAYDNQTNTISVHAILIDDDLQILKDFVKTSLLGSGFDIVNLCMLDSFVIGSGYQRYTFLPAYWVWDKNGNEVYSKTLDTIDGGAMTAISNYKGRLLFGLTYVSFYSRGEINTNDFTIDTIIRDDLSAGMLFISDYIYLDHTGKDTIYCYGGQSNTWFAWCRLDSNLGFIALDTFSTTYGKSTLVDRGMADASAEDKVYFVTAEDPKIFTRDLKPGLTNQMRMWRIKQNGDVVWSVLVNDSAYYLPTKTVATSDGGAVFFSMKYDWRVDSLPKTSLSIIKLDSTGNFVALSEMAIPYTERLGVEIFPNPCRDHITLAGIEARDVKRVLIYNIKGEVVAQYQNPENLKIESSLLENGNYLLQIVMRNGQIGVYKLMKK